MGHDVKCGEVCQVLTFVLAVIGVGFGTEAWRLARKNNDRSSTEIQQLALDAYKLVTSKGELNVTDDVTVLVQTETGPAVVPVGALMAKECWDQNNNGLEDPEEDLNQDGKWDTADCYIAATVVKGIKGDKGDRGPPGPAVQGRQGPRGPRGDNPFSEQVSGFLNTSNQAVRTDSNVEFAEVRIGTCVIRNQVGRLMILCDGRDSFYIG